MTARFGDLMFTSQTYVFALNREPDHAELSKTLLEARARGMTRQPGILLESLADLKE
jgi:hypothetical protein